MSPTSVSHALSGKRKVSDDVRERVERAMQELNYVPTRSAQNLALGSTRILALVVPDIGIEYFAELAKSVERAAMERRYNLMLATTMLESESEARYLDMVNSRAVDGIVYVAGASLDSRERQALLRELPLVLLDEGVDGVELPTVVSDNEAGGRLAGRHLADLGHRRALIFGSADPLMTDRRRIDGFRSVWSTIDGQLSEDHSGDLSEPTGRALVEQYARRFLDREITAVFAYNDPMALGVINGLRTLGLTVPEDISVMGFDDSSAGSYSYPTLTTIRQDVAGLGARSVNLLVDALEARRPVEPVRIELPVELVVRNSTGKVAHG